MLARTALGIVILVGFLALGSTVATLRRSGEPVVRTVAGKVHRGVGFVAVAVVCTLALTALRLLLD